MTRRYIMVNRLGREQGIEIEHTTKRERQEYFVRRGAKALEHALNWIEALTGAVADLERERGRTRKAHR